MLSQETIRLKPTVRHNKDLDRESIKQGCWLCWRILCKHLTHTSSGTLVGTGGGISVIVAMVVEVTVDVMAEVTVDVMAEVTVDVIAEVNVDVIAEVTVEVVVAEMTVVRVFPSCSRLNLC